MRILFENGAGTPATPGAPVPAFEHSFDAWPIPTLQPTVWYFADNGRLDSSATTSDGGPTGDD